MSENPFKYPINETLGIGDVDPIDFKRIDGKWVLVPGWWKNIKPKGDKESDAGNSDTKRKAYNKKGRVSRS